jgi:hypothetical protein
VRRPERQRAISGWTGGESGLERLVGILAPEFTSIQLDFVFFVPFVFDVIRDTNESRVNEKDHGSSSERIALRCIAVGFHLAPQYRHSNASDCIVKPSCHSVGVNA